MSLSPLAIVAISAIALVVAHFINLASDRYPIAKNIAIGIAAAVLLLICFDLWS